MIKKTLGYKSKERLSEKGNGFSCGHGIVQPDIILFSFSFPHPRQNYGVFFHSCQREGEFDSLWSFNTAELSLH